jgi:hypothetical protein
MATQLLSQSELLPLATREWPLLLCTTLSEVELALSDKRFIHAHIIRGCRRMCQLRKTSDMCLEIFCVETAAVIWISCLLEEAEAALLKILKWREEREEFEDCPEIVELLANIKAQNEII